MSNLVRLGVQKLPTMLGVGILSVSVVGLAAASLGLSLTLGAEIISAAAGMALGSRYS
ncbi:hypothetical protein [Sphingomonas sp. UYP23]